MTSLKILAAALVLGSAVPAIASEGATSMPTGQIEFLQTGAQNQRLIEGRNSDRVIVNAAKAQAAASQGFAPVNTTLEGPSR